MSFDPDQFRSLIRRSLMRIGMESESAVELLMLTAAHESHLGTYLHQVRGPAIGVFQVEPLTHMDHWRYLKVKKRTDPALFARVTKGLGVEEPDLFRLESDLNYQIIDARVHYYMIPEPLPRWNDIPALARYWDVHYNRNPDKGFPEQAVKDYLRYGR